MKDITIGSLEKSISYYEFRTFVTQSLLNNPEALQIDSVYLPYAELNETRLKRLDKTMKVEAHEADILKNLTKKYIWLVLTESWCGDAAQSVPVMNKLAEASSGVIEMRLVFRDQNLELMDLFLTNGGRSIPKLLVLDKETLEVLGDWGPRPSGATRFLEDYKSAHGSVDEEGKTGLQMWYTKDKGEEVRKEIVALMQRLDK